MMNITVFNKGGMIHYHAAGCRDITRGENRFWSQDKQTFPDIDTAIANYLDTDDENNPGWLYGDMEFFPCIERIAA